MGKEEEGATSASTLASLKHLVAIILWVECFPE